MSNLITSTIHGIIWTGISRFSIQGFQIVVTAILARLLCPEDFGIVGVAAIFSGLVKTVNELGLSAAIIQRKELDESHLSTSFWANLGMGVFIFIATVIIAPLVADFFSEDIVAPVVIVSAIGFLIGPFGIIHSTLLTKELNFKKLAFIEITATFASGIAGVAMAFAGLGVWSLVLMRIMANLVSVILLWVVFKWRPSMQFSVNSFKELFGFGANVTGHRIVNYIGANIDYLVVGKFLGTSALGLYTLAYNLATYPQRRLSSVITKVTFPAFAKIQDDDERLRRGYLKSIKYISLVVFPLLTGLIVVAPQLVRVVYGEKWLSIILPLQILCLAGLSYSISTTVGSIFKSKGRPDIELKMTLICRVGILGAFVLVGIRYNITGIATAVAMYSVIGTFIAQWLVNRLIGLKVKDYLLSLYPAVIGCLVMVCVLAGYHFIQKVMVSMPDIILLLCSISVGAATYFLTLKLMKIEAFDELLGLIGDTLKPSLRFVKRKTLGIPTQ